MNFANVKSLTIPEGNVVRITDNQSRVLWKKSTGPDYSEPFYIQDLSGSANTISIKNINGIPITIECSTDKVNWSTLGTTPWGQTPITYTIPVNGKIYLRANTNYWSYTGSYYHNIACTGLFEVGGNIMSLLYGSNFTGNERTFPESRDHIFGRLFNGSDQYDNLKKADKLILPATTLVNFCYQYMFNGCTSLTTAPELPATTLAKSCYYQMFSGCSSLNYIKCLATDISASNCTYSWVYGVAAPGTFVKDANMSSWSTGTSGIPSSWTVQDA